jgi:hypothetical protein
MKKKEKEFDHARYSLFACIVFQLALHIGM